MNKHNALELKHASGDTDPNLVVVEKGKLVGTRSENSVVRKSFDIYIYIIM
jgi:hypothetical protein